MKGHNFQFEEFHVTEPISLALHRLDLVIGTLQWTIFSTPMSLATLKWFWYNLSNHRFEEWP
jgi:hypothetical protein